MIQTELVVPDKLVDIFDSLMKEISAREPENGSLFVTSREVIDGSVRYRIRAGADMTNVTESHLKLSLEYLIIGMSMARKYYRGDMSTEVRKDRFSRLSKQVRV